MTFTPTFKFKTLIPNFDIFKEKYVEYIPELLMLTDVQLQKIYKILYNNYCNCSVAYDTPSAFYRFFFNEIYNGADNYIIKTEMVSRLNNLSVDDLVIEYENIANVASNDNEIVTDPLSQIVPFISSQSTSRSKSNKAMAIIRALSAYRDNAVKEFVDRFQLMFITVIGDFGCYYQSCDTEMEV